jgi:hypothetical protein
MSSIRRRRGNERRGTKGTMEEMVLFTPQEANEALELVRPRVERLVQRRRELARAGRHLESVRAKVAGNGGSLHPKQVSELQERAARAAAEVADLVEAITSLGVQVKDLDRGLVDFPARHPETGETVLLCWELGEGSVAYWHGLEDGFAGRKPLPF